MSDDIRRSGLTSFVPHPSAHAADWTDLLLPVKEAVRELLGKLEGAACSAATVDAPPYTNCFLIHGDRGTGKTTVLLTAQDFVRKGGLGPKPKYESSECDDGFDIAQEFASKLHNRDVVWMDVLDLEPVPPRANLLMLLLTRVRDACVSSAGDIHRRNTREESSQLFSKHDGDARDKIRQLIGDASLMWEEVTESDTRSVASRRESSANLYTHFREEFADAMNAFTAETYERRGNEQGNSLLILPIDNIDRSPEHLASMVKLASLVSCPHFWLILAGERVDLETFLERAYWKDLIRVGDSAVGTGKLDRHGEDETLTMARRQAAAALQKLLPFSHRIEVKRVDPKETLEFRLGSQGQRIREMLSQLDLVERETKVSDGKQQPELCPSDGERTLLRLFCYRDPDTKECDLTRAGKMALTLPARNVVDLWQLVSDVLRSRLSASEHKDVPGDEYAIKVARTMLRQVIASSKMSSTLGIHLQYRVIDRDLDKGTVLHFEKQMMMNVKRLKRLLREIEAQPRPDVRSTLRFHEVGRFILRIVPPACHERPLDDEDLSEDLSEDLPDDVAGWMAVLHDLAAWSEKSFVVNSDIPTAPFVTVRHVMPAFKLRRPNMRRGKTSETSDESSDNNVSSMELTWPAPRWDVFAAHDFFRRKWKALFDEVKPEWDPDVILRKLVMGWINCSLHTFQWGARILLPLDDRWSPDEFPLPSSCVLCERPEVDEMTHGEVSVIERVEGLYHHLTKSGNCSSPIIDAGGNSWLLLMRDWLEWELPRLRSAQLVPRPRSNNKGSSVWRRFDEAWSEYAKQLTGRWQATQRLISSETEIRYASDKADEWRKLERLLK